MKKIIALLLITTLFIRCGGSENELESTFNNIKNIEDRFELLNELDQGSHDFIDKILAMSKANDADSITIFSNEYPSPLTTQLLVQSAKSIRPQFPKMNRLDILYLVDFLDMGFLGKEYKANYFYKGLEGIDGTTALVNAKYLAKVAPKKIYIESEFKFNKEEEKWKLNLPSTFSFSEQILNKLWRKWEGDESSFILHVIEKGRVEVEFSTPLVY